MNISYKWLRDLVETRMTPPELAECLTFVGLTVEAVHPKNDDFVLELDVTSNRGDCLSHLGVAREVAAAEHSRLRRLPTPTPESAASSSFPIIYPKTETDCCEGRTSDLAAVEILDADLCPRYAARIIRGVKIAPSPAWLVKRLEAIGQRPLNNVADITNYVLHELGQPLHAFDLATLTGAHIIVRRAAEGEKMKTLDGVERTFDREMLLICDAAKPVAVAGVMGGLETEITDATTDVLLESAYFTPATVRRTSKLLGLSTEAAKRFERGVDPEGVRRAQDRAAALMWEIAGGTVTEDAIDVYPAPVMPVSLSVRPERVKLLSGLDVAAEEITRILVALGFTVQGEAEGRLVFTAPTWRHDMEREEDLIEEVARHIGYDQIPDIVPPSTQAGSYLAGENRRRAVRQALAANGYDEAINFSFISDAQDETFEFLPDFVAQEGDAEARFVTLSNSIIEGKPRMRATLLPGLLEAVRRNLNHGTRDVRLFELGRLFATREGQTLPAEREAFALVATGRAIGQAEAASAAELDFYDVKGALEAVTSAMHLPPLRYEAATVKHLREGQAARLFLADGRCIGTVGRLSESISTIYKFRQAVYLAELDLAAALTAESAAIRYSPLPRHPAIIRDLSLLVARRVTWADLHAAVTDLGLPYCRNLSIIEVYEGVHVPEGQRSVTLRLEYRAQDETLRDEDADTAHAQVIAALAARCGAQQRF